MERSATSSTVMIMIYGNAPQIILLFFSKSAKSKKIIKPGMIMDLFLKKPNNIPDFYLPLAMAVIGDSGDDVEGVKGVGPARFLEIFDDLIKLTGDMKTIYNNVENGNDIFISLPDKIQNKYLRKVVKSETK
jgi:5'-3' exonuclease